MTSVNDPAYWLQRSEEMRVLAGQINDEFAKRTILRIARDYETLATRAQTARLISNETLSWEDG
jgi:hypothetical protein